jgi:hypothetical protein
MVVNNYLDPAQSVCDYPLEVVLHVPNFNVVMDQELTSLPNRYFPLMVQKDGVSTGLVVIPL